MRYVVLLLLSLFMPVPASFAVEPIYIGDDPGGRVDDYVNYYNILPEGTRIVVDGQCMSACAIVLFDEYVNKYDVCATDRAIFGFHMPYMAKTVYNSNGDEDIEVLTGVDRSDDSLYEWNVFWLANLSPKAYDAVKDAIIPNPSVNGDTGKMFAVKGTKVLPRC